MPPKPNFGKRTKQRDLEEIRVALNAGPVAPTGAVDHGALTGLTDDDHSIYVHLSSARTITAQHSFSPSSARAPFALGANAQGELVTGLNADLLDGLHASEVGVTDAQYLVISNNGTLTDERAFSAGAGLTATDGGANSTYTVDIGTPSSSTVSSTNATTASSHSHAVTASADVGTTPAAALLKSSPSGGLILATLEVKGATTITGGDLTADAAGATFIVDQSQHNVGIGTLAPDPQFSLDVAGPMRAQYYIGPHALQIADALIISHFDGPGPVETNYRGEATGHRGQRVFLSGGSIFRYGKFGKALLCATSATNYTDDPIMGKGDLTEWTTSANLTVTRDATRSYAGSYSMKCTPTGGGSDNYNYDTTWWRDESILAAGFDTTFSLYIYMPTGTDNTKVKLKAYEDTGGGLTQVGSDSVAPATFDEWVRITLSVSFTVGASDVWLRFHYDETDTGKPVWFDGFQVDRKAYATPLCSGDFGGYSAAGVPDGSGHIWASTAHASQSARVATNAYAPYTGNVNPVVGTVMAWIWLEDLAGASQYVYRVTGATAGTISLYIDSSGNLRGTWGTTSVGGTTAVSVRQWHHVAMTYSGSTLTLYLNGASAGSGTSSGFAGGASNFYIGKNSSAADWLNGYIDELAVTESAMDADEILSIYESNAPVFAETSIWSWRTISTEGAQVFVNEEGLWMYDSSGGAVVGFSGVNSKSWGGTTLNQGDILFGAYGASDGGWLLFNRDGVNSDGLLSLGYGTAEVIRFDDGGASLYGVLDIDTSGGIYQGTGSFASPTTGLKMWNNSGIGCLAGYNGGTLQAGFTSDGYFVGGGGDVVLWSDGIQIATGSGKTTNKLKWKSGSSSIFYMWAEATDAYVTTLGTSGTPTSTMTLISHNYAVSKNSSIVINSGNVSSGSVVLDADGTDLTVQSGVVSTENAIRAGASAIAPDTGEVMAMTDIIAFGGVSVGSNGDPPQGVIMFLETSEPADPPSGKMYLYAKTDGKLYSKNDVGYEKEL